MINYTTATNGKTKTFKNPTPTRSRFNIFKLLSAFALVMVLGLNGVKGQIAAFNNTWSGTPASVTATTIDANLGTITMTRGSGITASSSSAGFRGISFASGASLTIGNNDYFTFTLTANSGYAINLNSAVLSISLGSSGTGPQTYGVYSSVGGFASTAAQIGANLTASASQTITIPSSGYNSLSSIEIRIYGWNASAAGGSGGPSAISLSGSVSAAATNYFWNGNTASPLSADFNTGQWATSASVAPSLAWPSSGSTNVANFSNLQGGTVTMPTTFNTTPSNVIIGSAGYTFSTASSTPSTLSSTINLDANALTLSPNATSAALTLSGIISGTSGSIISNTGTTTLSGINTFTGGLTLSSGQLNINNASALGTTAGTFTINGGTIDNTFGSGVTTSNYPQTWGGDFAFTGSNALNLGTGAVSLSASRQVTVNASTLTVGGIISGNTFSLTKAGSGTLALGGVSTFNGGLTINGGTVQMITGTNRLASATAVTLANTAGVVFDLNSQSQAVGSIAGGGTTGGNITLGSATLSTGGANTSTSFGGVISGTSGILTKTGSGALTLSGANTHTGGTTLSAGTLNINNAAALGTGTFTVSGGTIDNTSGSAINTSTNNNAQTWGGNFTFTGTNALNLGTGAVSLSASRQVTVNASTLTLGGIISGNTFSLTKAGSGTLALTNGSNSYSGGTTINAGILALTGSGSIATSPTITVGSSGTFDVSGLTSALTLDVSQTLRGSATGSNTTGTIKVASSKNLTLSAGGLIFTALAATTTPPLTVDGTGGNLVLVSGCAITVPNNLTAGTYTLIAKSGNGAEVSGTPGTLSYTGSGNNTSATVALTSGELILTVTSTLTPPTLTAAGSATVDAAFNVTFTDDATWRGAITSITVGGTTLTAGYSVSSGQITFTPSASIPTNLLQSSGSKSIVINATGYANATVTQNIGVGAANRLAITTQPTAPANNGAALAQQPIVVIRDQYNNTTTSTATITAAVGAGSWTLGGTTSVAAISGTTTYSGLTATSVAAVTGATIAFTSAGLTSATSGTFNIPAPPPANDLCASPTALTINGGNQSGTTVAATYTTLTSEPFTAYSDVWYTFTPSSSGNITITTSTTGVDYDLYVFSTCPSFATSYVNGGNAANTGNTSETLTFSATSSTTYFIRVVNTTSSVGSAFTINATMPPTLTAAGSATVDAAFNVTFTDDATWRGAITSITVGGTTLTAGYSVSSGQITFTPSSSNPANLLQSSGSKSIVVIATGYANATVSQSIGFGAAAKLGITTQPTAPASNGAVLAIQPLVAIQDQYGNTVTSSSASVLAAKSDAGTWTLGGTTSVAAISGVVTFSGLTASSAAAVSNATLAFTSSPLTASGNSSTFNIPAPDYLELTSAIPTQTQNFDGIGSTQTASLPQGFGIQSGVSGTLTYATTEVASSGSPTTGGTYNWGQNGTSDRAAGFMFSNGYSGRSIVLKVRNNTGSPLGSFTLSFDYEQYRKNTISSQTFKLQYSTSLTAGWVDVTNGGFTSLITNNGGSVYNYTTLIASQSITNLSYTPAASVANGNDAYFRWTLDGSSSSNGVGIDNISITAGVINYYHQTTGTGCTGDLHDLDCWTSGAGGTGSVATSFTTDNQVFNVINSSPSTSAAWTVSGTNSKIVIGGSSYGDRVLTITATNPITGTIDINQSGATSNSLIITSSTLPTLGTLHSSANVTYNAAGAQSIATKSFRNLTLGGSGVKTLSGSVVVTGTLTVPTGVTLDFGSNVVSGTGDVDVQSGATVITANTSGLNGSNTTSGGLSNYSTGASYSFNGGSSQVFGAALPATVNNLTINNGNTEMALNASQIINATLTITSGKLAIGANTLTLNGGLSNDATNSLSTTASSNITLTGVAKTIYYDASNNTLKNLSITGSNTMTLGNALNITGGTTFGVVTVGSGATLATGGNLTLKSDANGTACIGSSAGNVSGSVTVERFVSGAGRRWRFLSSPVTSATVNNWMSQFYVTGPGDSVPANRVNGSTLGTLNTNGWHTSLANINFPSSTMSSNPSSVKTTSIRTYNESVSGNNTNLNAGWENLSSTSQALIPGQGFRVFIRGAANNTGQLDGSVTSQSAVTLALTGTVNQGSITLNSGSTFPITNATQGWNLIGNPYPCAYNIAAHYTGNSNSLGANCSTLVYIYNPTAGTAGYAGYNANGGAASGTGLSAGIIPSGGAFFIKANVGSPTFTFQEAYKTTTTAPSGLHKTDVNDQFEIKYSKDSVESDYLTVKMYNGATLNYDAFDILKIRNDNLNLAAYGEDTMQVSASVIQPVVSETRIKLNVEATLIGTYTFDFKNMDNFQSNITVSLFDRYTNKTTDVRKNTKYTFDMGAGVNQWGKNRFELILNGKATTGVNENTTNVESTTLSVYPNPATDVLNISLSNGTSIETVNIYNVSGKLVNNIKLNGNQIDISQLNNGVYMVEVLTVNGTFKTKFVK